MIDDRMEEGMSEEEAVSDVGEVQDIADRILGEIPLSKLVRSKVKPKRALRVWEIILLALGSPIWLSVAVALVAVVLSVYIVLWSVALSVYAATLSVGLSGVALTLGCALFFVRDGAAAGLVALGCGLLLAGIAIFLLFGCHWGTKGLVWLSKKIWLLIKKCFVGGTEK